MAKKLLTSPRGIASYPHLNKPDTKFDADGVYTIKVVVSKKDEKAKALIKLIDTEMAAVLKLAKDEAKGPKAVKKVKPCEDKPYSFETDEDDKPTGNVVFTFKMKASGKNRKTGETFNQKPAVFDASAKPLINAKIGGGSEVKVSFEIVPFYQVKIGAGVSLRMSAVQVLKLVEWGTGDGTYYGFENEAPEEDEDSDDEDEAEDEDEEEEKEDF